MLFCRVLLVRLPLTLTAAKADVLSTNRIGSGASPSLIMVDLLGNVTDVRATAQATFGQGLDSRGASVRPSTVHFP
jgi:hypothetical protein